MHGPMMKFLQDEVFTELDLLPERRTLISNKNKLGLYKKGCIIILLLFHMLILKVRYF